MSDLQCVNEACERHGVVIANPFGYPAEATVCVCGEPLEALEAEPDALEPAGEPGPGTTDTPEDSSQ